ncbi:MAG TPA: hypothetical protein VFE23_10990 [Usitatibacter sp.]|jgi:hypothetical protein|nr:hypothetical protein [Usitatibacter sp.]
MESPVPRPVPYSAIAAWIASSCRLVVRKAHYWVALDLLLFACAIALTFVPWIGNWLRGIAGQVSGAFLLALAHSQATERHISVRRALSMVDAVLPTVLLISVLQVALFEAVELPILYAIATPEEFAVYAFSDLRAAHPRPAVDLVHSAIGIALGTVFAFAVPLALFERTGAVRSLRLSVAAFARSPGVYLVFAVATALVPHSLAYLGAAGALFFIALEIFVVAAGYFAFRSAFGDLPLADQARP